jgi:hypothetical protein
MWMIKIGEVPVAAKHRKRFGLWFQVLEVRLLTVQGCPNTQERVFTDCPV